MTKLTVQLQGVDEIIKGFEKFGKEGALAAKEVVEATTHDLVGRAKKYAKAQKIWDTGKLVQNIWGVQIDNLNWQVQARMRYSAYMEFGTGRLTAIPPGWEDIASEFRGQGIKEVNILPRPYMYPAYKDGLKLYPKDMQFALDNLTKKYNG